MSKLSDRKGTHKAKHLRRADLFGQLHSSKIQGVPQLIADVDFESQTNS